METDAAPNPGFDSVTLRIENGAHPETTTTTAGGAGDVAYQYPAAAGQDGVRIEDGSQAGQATTATSSEAQWNGVKVQPADVQSMEVKRRIDLCYAVRLAQNFFCHREGEIDKAIQICSAELTADDGQIVNSWVLTLIDHWDHERERLVILCENRLVLFKYNFCSRKIDGIQRVNLSAVDTFIIGNFVYPSKGLFEERGHGGVKLSWARGQEPGFLQKWNPLAQQPYVQLADHPIMYRDPACAPNPKFHAENFAKTVAQVLARVQQSGRMECELSFFEGDILIESYASPQAAVFNQSMLGYARERGGISY